MQSVTGLQRKQLDDCRRTPLPPAIRRHELSIDQHMEPAKEPDAESRATGMTSLEQHLLADRLSLLLC